MQGLCTIQSSRSPLEISKSPSSSRLAKLSKPGKYDLRSDLTVTEAVAIAGGFNDKAKHSQVVLFRPVSGGGGYEAKLIDVKKLLATRNLSEDPQVRPGDMIYVPQSAFSKIRPFLPTTSMGTYYNPAMY